MSSKELPEALRRSFFLYIFQKKKIKKGPNGCTGFKIQRFAFEINPLAAVRRPIKTRGRKMMMMMMMTRV